VLKFTKQLTDFFKIALFRLFHISAINKKCFRIDVTFEMRTVHYRKAFFQLIILTPNLVSFISKWKRGKEDNIAERPREAREREQVKVEEGCSVGH
jgi:hypothetical protein